MKKVALITGITGQDGSYLADLLLSKDYEVHGIYREKGAGPWRFAKLGIQNEIKLHLGKLDDLKIVRELIGVIKPDEIYHLAAQSSIPESCKDPVTTINFNILSTQNILETVRQLKLPTKIFHASSSEIFDPEAPSPISTHSNIKPVHPYGVAKATCHFLIQLYRNSYGIYAVNGILFPHESPLRDRGTILKFFISQAEEIKKGNLKEFTLAAPENIRDFGDATSYVEVMWLSLQAKKADDYIICSGNPISIKEITEYILAQYSLSKSYIKIDDSLVRQPNIPIIFGDSSETTQKLGWSNTISIYETIKNIIGLQNKTDHEA